MHLELTECKARLAWASRHLQQLREEITAYEQSGPYTTRQVFTPKQCMASLYVNAKPLPTEVSFIAGDVLHNLRSTLDHLAWQLARTTGATTPAFPLGDDSYSESWRRLLFPLRPKPQQGDSLLPERLRALHPDLKAFLRDIQPFVASDEPRLATVWMLNELSNVDKHRIALEAVPSLYETKTLTITIPIAGPREQKWECVGVPRMLKGELLLATVWFDKVPLLAPRVELEHSIRVAFDDGLGILPGMPVITTLEMCEAMVAYILRRAGQIDVNLTPQ